MSMANIGGANHISQKGAGGNYYRSTGNMTMRGMFAAHIDTEKLYKTQEAFAFVLEEMKAGEIDVGKLHIVGDNAVKYAKQLLDSQIYGYSTGALKNSIGYSVVKNEDGRQSLEIYASAVNKQGIPYGTFVEYGSHPRGGATYVQPRPFLRPAIEFARANTANNIQETLKHIFEDITRGDYRYTDMHFSDKKEIRTMGNRALATKSSVRNTSNNKSYGRPTRTSLDKLGKNIQSHYNGREEGARYNGISKSIRWKMFDSVY